MARDGDRYRAIIPVEASHPAQWSSAMYTVTPALVHISQSTA